MSEKLTDEEIKYIKDWINRSKEAETNLAVIRWKMLEKIASGGVWAFLVWISSLVIEHYQRK